MAELNIEQTCETLPFYIPITEIEKELYQHGWVPFYMSPLLWCHQMLEYPTIVQLDKAIEIHQSLCCNEFYIDKNNSYHH